MGEVALVKAAVLDTNVVGSANAEVGDQITYTYTVTNTDPVLNALNVVVTEDPANFTGDFSQLTTPSQISGGVDLDGSGALNDLGSWPKHVVYRDIYVGPVGYRQRDDRQPSWC